MFKSQNSIKKSTIATPVKSVAQQSLRGLDGVHCTTQDILIASNATNNLDEKYGNGAQIINGFRKNIKWECAPEYIKMAEPVAESKSPVSAVPITTAQILLDLQIKTQNLKARLESLELSVRSKPNKNWLFNRRRQDLPSTETMQTAEVKKHTATVATAPAVTSQPSGLAMRLNERFRRQQQIVISTVTEQKVWEMTPDNISRLSRGYDGSFWFKCPDNGEMIKVTGNPPPSILAALPAPPPPPPLSVGSTIIDNGKSYTVTQLCSTGPIFLPTEELVFHKLFGRC